MSRKGFHFLRYVGSLGHILVVVKIKEDTDQSCFSLADLLDEILSKQGAGTEQTKSKKDCNILSRGSSLDKATRSDDVRKDRTTLDKPKDARFDMHR